MMVFRTFHRQPVLNYGIDFTGGSTLTIDFDELHRAYETTAKKESREALNVSFIKKVRDALQLSHLEKSTIQVSDNGDIMIRTIPLSETQRKEVLQNLSKIGAYELLEVDIIGPSIGKELRGSALLITLIVTACLLVYLSWRFEFKFGIAAVAASVHDGLLTFCMASILNLEINTAFIAALLIILGYSLNDTIIIFDRIRETRQIYPNDALDDVLNLSITQTLNRTLYTALTTLIMISCLFFFGGATIHDFSLILIIGIGFGTYSSICIASPILYLLLSRKATEK